MLLCTFLAFFVVFHHKTCVFIILISFFDKVSNFRNRILTNQKRELVVSNCHRNCMIQSEFVEYIIGGNLNKFLSTFLQFFYNLNQLEQLLELYRTKGIYHRDMSYLLGVLNIYAKFAGKHLYLSLFFNKIAGPQSAILSKKRFRHRCFPVNCAKNFNNTNINTNTLQ